MITLKKCKEILNKNELKYSDEEIRIIRDLLYQMAELEYHKFFLKKQC